MVNPDTRVLTSLYDGARQRTVLVDPDAGRTTYGYDPAGRMDLVESPWAERTTFAYDAAGQKVRIERDNGTRTSFTYDDAGRTGRVLHAKAGGTLIDVFTYTYDNTPNRTAVLENGDRTTWTYDKTYQLTGEHRTGTPAWRHTFTYDPAGNRQTFHDGTDLTTYTYDDANRLRHSQTTAGRTTYTFDAAGNESRIETPTGDLTTYTWDFENQLQTAETPDNALTTYTWNAEQQRVAKDLDDGSSVKFVWDGQNLVQEYDEFDATQAHYTLQPQPDPQPYGDLLTQRREDETSFYHFDALGSTRALTDDAEVVTDEATYEAFGKTAASSGTTENTFGWTGETGSYSDAETDLQQNRRRMYDSEDSRFLSEDPKLFMPFDPEAEEEPDPNAYRYVGNDVTSFMDPSGLHGGPPRPAPKPAPAEPPAQQFDAKLVENLPGAYTYSAGTKSYVAVPNFALAGGELPLNWFVFRKFTRRGLRGAVLGHHYELDQLFPKYYSRRSIQSFYQHDVDQEFYEGLAATGTFVLHIIPGGAATDYASQGEWEEAGWSIAADLTLLAGGLGKALQVGRTAGRVFATGRAIQKMAPAARFGVDLALAARRAQQARQHFQEGDEIRAWGELGEVSLLMMGLSPDAVHGMRAVHRMAKSDKTGKVAKAFFEGFNSISATKSLRPGSGGAPSGIGAVNEYAKGVSKKIEAGTKRARAALTEAAAVPTRLGIIKELGAAAQPHVKAIKSIAPDAQVGFRGSLARGKKGEHKGNVPFDPSNFDVDAFIVSDSLAGKFPKETRFRAGDLIPELTDIQKSLDSSLRSSTSFVGLRQEPFTFRIFTKAEMEALLKKSDPQIYFIPGD